MCAATTPFREPGSQVGGAVQSIRIAITVSKRYGELLDKHKLRPGQIEPLLAEARHLYPEMWSHLDDANAALTRQGIAIAGYSELRGSHPLAGGVLDVRVPTTQEQIALHLAGGTGKSAHLNAEGHGAAVAACALLQRGLPQIDWEALDRADQLELDAAGALGPPWWKKTAFYTAMSVLIAIAIAGFIYARLNRPRANDNRIHIAPIHIDFDHK